MRLVGDCVRLGGAILSNHPGDQTQIFCLFCGMLFLINLYNFCSEMLGAQITGRLLPEQSGQGLVQALIRQCDTKAARTNALVPVHHCLHTPGGALKFSLEGHQVSCDWWRAVLTSDWWRAVLTSDWWRAVLT